MYLFEMDMETFNSLESNVLKDWRIYDRCSKFDIECIFKRIILKETQYARQLL